MREHEKAWICASSSSKYTCQNCCTVKTFLSLLSNSKYFQETMVKHLNKLNSLLSDPESKYPQQLHIKYDLIEVSDGFCFFISESFVQNAIRVSGIGRETPRAYVPYKHNKVPELHYNKEILENSLSNTEIQFFSQYFIRLLHYGTKQHKENVPCLIGEPNSGKTSLFAPITRIIPER